MIGDVLTREVGVINIDTQLELGQKYRYTDKKLKDPCIDDKKIRVVKIKNSMKIWLLKQLLENGEYSIEQSRSRVCKSRH